MKLASMLPTLRNVLVEDALDWGANYLLWVDADHVFPPECLLRLDDRQDRSSLHKLPVRLKGRWSPANKLQPSRHLRHGRRRRGRRGGPVPHYQEQGGRSVTDRLVVDCARLTMAGPCTVTTAVKLLARSSATMTRIAARDLCVSW